MSAGEQPHFTKRRVLLIELDAPEHAWSSTEMTMALAIMAPMLRAVVWGEVGVSDVDAAFRKVRQISRETEEDDSKGNRVHSAHKAVLFFRDMFPTNFWNAKGIGVSR